MINTRWAQCLQRNQRPSEADLREHLLTIHRYHPGFTESCAGRCRDTNGRNSYEWLAEIIDPNHHRTVLDLACGSGALMAHCHKRFGSKIDLIGVDMSAEELALARRRLPVRSLQWHCGMAQDMAFIADESIDVVLCHWALTLMDPVEPVLGEVRRVLRPSGVFAAIIDGELAAARGYAELHNLIYRWVQREYPAYGAIDMGDARVRTTTALAALTKQSFKPAQVRIEPEVVSLTAAPDVLAREAAAFFYASFVLSPLSYKQMLRQLETLFAAQGRGLHSVFAMPINRLVVRPACNGTLSEAINSV